MSLIIYSLRRCWLNYAGYERESSWYSTEADLFRNEQTHIYPQRWAFSLIFMARVISQMNYLNKVFRFIHSEFERYFPTFIICSILDNSRVIQVINVK
jgi:hypothetical protein